MRIYLRGSNKRFPAKDLREFARWALDKMLGELAKDVSIFINSVPQINADDDYGQCETYHLDSADRLPRRFIITLCNRHTLVTQKRILGHELRHVDQFRRGDLQMGWVRWKKKKMVSPEVDYNNQPWEKQAKKSQNLYKEFERLKNEGRGK